MGAEIVAAIITSVIIFPWLILQLWWMFAIVNRTGRIALEIEKLRISNTKKEK